LTKKNSGGEEEKGVSELYFICSSKEKFGTKGITVFIIYLAIA
jgi:hypothetical protein